MVQKTNFDDYDPTEDTYIKPALDESGKLDYDIYEAEEWFGKKLDQVFADSANIGILVGEVFALPIFSEIGLGWGGTEIYMFESNPDFVEKENVKNEGTKYKNVNMVETVGNFITSIF